MNILAIDYGLSKIGLAISLDSPLAEPFETIKHKSDQKTAETILKLIQIHKIDKIILGLPEGKLKPTIENFQNLISQTTSVSIEFYDEKNSSQEAQFHARQAGKSKGKIKQQEHQIAATIILQNYLDNH